MKLFTVFLFLVTFAMTAYAEQPAYLKDATITVTLTNGKTYTYSANEYMVVKRGAKAKLADSPAPRSESKQDPKSSAYRNRVSVLVGYGPNGKLKDKMSSSTVDVENEKGVVGGVSLQHDINSKYFIQGDAFTNQSFFLGFGRGF